MYTTDYLILNAGYENVQLEQRMHTYVKVLNHLKYNLLCRIIVTTAIVAINNKAELFKSKFLLVVVFYKIFLLS